MLEYTKDARLVKSLYVSSKPENIVLPDVGLMLR
jgi:hypothetical protein